MSELDPEGDLLKLATYGMLAQFWSTLSLKEELWEDDARSILLLQKDLIEEAATTLGRHLDEPSMKRFRDFTEPSIYAWFSRATRKQGGSNRNEVTPQLRDGKTCTREMTPVRVGGFSLRNLKSKVLIVEVLSRAFKAKRIPPLAGGDGTQGGYGVGLAKTV